MKKRFLSILLAACMVLSLMPVTAFAADNVVADSGDSTLCEHHTEHNEDCGYIEVADELPCNHEHDDECVFILAVEAIPQTEEIPCDKECTDTDGDGIIDHTQDCAYTPAVAEIPAVEGAPCNHAHNDTCSIRCFGYRQSHRLQ